MKKSNMNIKNLLVSFVALASILLLTAGVNAADFSNVEVTVDGIDASDNLALVAGEVVTAKVFFNSNIDTSDLKVRLEVEGDSVDVDATTSDFEVEAGHRYRKVLTLRVPHELEDDVSDDVTLNLRIWGGDSDTYRDSWDVRVQRPSYDVDFMSISTSQTAEAGKFLPVNVVLKNVGYNDLDDLYVTVRIPELDVEKTAYFGDIISVEDDDNDDVVSGRILLEIPYEAKNGIYTLDVEAASDNLNLNKVKEIVVQNGFSSNVFVSGNEILVANPTNQLLVLRLIPESTGFSVSLSEDLLVIPAGSSRTVTASSSGEDYKVNIFSRDGELIDSVTLSATERAGGNAVAVLTVVLTIIFLVLLVVLIVLVTKKPEKSEEFSESYY